MTALEVYLEVSNCRRYASPSARAHLKRPPLETAPSVSNRKGQSPAPSARVAHDGARGEQSQALSLEAICLALTSPSARAHLARPPLETAPSVSNHKGNHRRSHQRALPTTALERRRGRASRSQSWIAVRARPRFLVGWEGGERSRHGRRMRTCGHATLERGTSPGSPSTTESVKRAP